MPSMARIMTPNNNYNIFDTTIKQRIMECKNGFVDAPVPAGIDIKREILDMCEKKNAVIMAHYYTHPDVQDLAHFVGDSLALAQKAANTSADIIVMCGVHFMGETCKILCPSKVVLVPDLNASCSLAESCPAPQFEQFVKAHPGHTVVSYVNTTAATKALTDVVVTSSNALQVVNSLPGDTPIIFGPDKNLGAYINHLTGRNMLLWQGSCHVHERFSLDAIKRLMEQHPQAKVLVHPECPSPIVALAHKVGSTAALLKYSLNSEAQEFIVVTESGILHEMKKGAPHKTFIPAPTCNEGTCRCNDCEYMKLITLHKLYNCLKHEQPTIEVPPAVAAKAVHSITRMLDISAQLGL